MHHRRMWRVIAVLLLVLTALVAPTQRALAHANLVSSDPSSGGRVDVMPPRLRLEYTEGVQSLDVRVTDTPGAHYEVGAAEPDPTDKRVRTVTLRDGLPGIYTVTWQALSVDGHTTEGSFFFLVGNSIPDRDTLLARFADAALQSQSTPNVFEVAGRSLLYIAMSLLAGLPLAVIVTDRSLIGSSGAWPVIKGALRWAAAGVIVGTLVLALKEFGSGYHWAISGIPTYLSSGQGYAALVRVAAAALVAGMLRFDQRRGLMLAAAFVAALVTQASVSIVSHSHTLLSAPDPLLADFGHLVGVGLWLGGVLLLALLLPRAWPDASSEERRLHTSTVGRRFSVVAMIGAGLVATAGCLLASWHLGDWHEVLTSLYGQAVIGKTALLSAALGLGALHRLRLVRAMEGRSASAVRNFTLSVRVEAVLLLAIVVLSAVMTSTETGTAAATSNRGGQVRLSEDVRGVDVRLTVVPGTPGFNVFDVEFQRDGKPVERVEAPALLLRLPADEVELDEVQLQPTGNGRYSAVAALTQPGQWFARVSADVDGAFTAGRFTLPESRAGANPYLGDPGFVRLAQTAAAIAAFVTALGVGYELMTRRHERVGLGLDDGSNNLS